jgi:hypothetical protein
MHPPEALAARLGLLYVSKWPNAYISDVYFLAMSTFSVAIGGRADIAVKGLYTFDP